MPRGHDLVAIADAIGADTRLVFLCNPNNPTGTWFDGGSLRRFLAAMPPSVLVVVDEAYQEYVQEPGLPSATGLLWEFPNLVVTRTFSKAYGLAGLRVGYACAHPGTDGCAGAPARMLNVSLPGLAGAAAALATTRTGAGARIQRQRARLARRPARPARVARLAFADQFSYWWIGAPAAAVQAALVARGVVPGDGGLRAAQLPAHQHGHARGQPAHARRARRGRG